MESRNSINMKVVLVVGIIGKKVVKKIEVVSQRPLFPLTLIVNHRI